ncbi:MAG: hypothetical protein IT313_07630 [Anaerolineales bacterium]|nr:hypothetical protein [Anaerolineales bacterium]
MEHKRHECRVAGSVFTCEMENKALIAMMNSPRKHFSFFLFGLMLIATSLACGSTNEGFEKTPQSPDIVLQRLGVAFLGQDNHKIIGSGCPGTDGKGTIVDYHLIVSGVDENKKVERILVAGDNSTLTWELPCSTTWALSATELGNGNWEIFIAPSSPSRIYTVIFFYNDNTFALGMGLVP